VDLYSGDNNRDEGGGDHLDRGFLLVLQDQDIRLCEAYDGWSYVGRMWVVQL